MILTVAGWREFEDHEFVRMHVGRYLNFYVGTLHVRVGNGRGSDAIVTNFCRRVGIPHTVYVADWAKYAARGGPIRNGHMLKGAGNPQDPNPLTLADKLLAFPQPGSKWWSDKGCGTGDCIRQASELGISLDIPGYKSRGE